MLIGVSSNISSLPEKQLAILKNKYKILNYTKIPSIYKFKNDKPNLLWNKAIVDRIVLSKNEENHFNDIFEYI